MFIGILVVTLEEILGIFDCLTAFFGGLMATFGRRVRLFFACLDALWDKYGPLHHAWVNFGPRWTFLTTFSTTFFIFFGFFFRNFFGGVLLPRVPLFLAQKVFSLQEFHLIENPQEVFSFQEFGTTVGGVSLSPPCPDTLPSRYSSL